MHTQRSPILPADLPPGGMKLSYAQFRLLPDDGKRHEIIDGDLYVSPSPSTAHQRAALRLTLLLHRHVVEHKLGEVFIAPLDILLSEHDIVEPDIIYVSNARAHIVAEKHIIGAPDLVVEVLSPSTSQRDLELKRAAYARCSIPCYWIVDPAAKTLLALQLDGLQYVTEGEAGASDTVAPRLFPGLELRLADLWD